MIAAAHQTMMGPQGAPLPYDAEVEYLESTGTQYVDTGVEADYRMGFEMQITPFGSSATRMGAMSASQDASLGAYVRYYIIQNATNIAVALRTNPGIVLANPAQAPGSTDQIVASYDPATRAVAIGGGSNTAAEVYSTPWTTGNTFHLFAQKQSNVQYYATAKLFYAKFWTDGVLVRSFVPVRVGQVGYLFDRVSVQLFGNAGTGAFTIGPDK